MEDLYSNLENYEDVNAVDELKNENRELKNKLEECTKTMNLLQKDFEKLNGEYKKLEVNYSSLLKTARAEIERKTQLITNLNKEKDAIVIRAMQGGCRNVLKNVNKPVHNYKKKDTNKKDGVNTEMSLKSKPGASGHSREGLRESPSLLIKDNTIVSATNISTSSEHNLRELDGYSKESMSKSAQQTNNCNKPKTAKISDRRKSVPVLSKGQEQINSDQDYENFAEDSRYLGSKGGKKNYVSEQFTNESKQTYNRAMDRYNQNIDRYALYNQNYGNYSPERGRQQHRGGDYSHRSDYYRQRVSESPPKDKYNRSKSRDRRHREREHRRDFDYYNSRYEENYDARSNVREPDPKRCRMDSSSTDRERHDQAPERRSYRLSEYRPDAAFDNHTSCQSPDYDQIESNLGHHYIKEIKNTATVPLEDPRISSKKYSLQECDRGTFITTVDKNICMIPLDTTIWGLKKIEVPEALKASIWEEPASADIVKSVYMDVVEPANISSSKSFKNRTDHGIVEFKTSGIPDSQEVCRKDCSTSDENKEKLHKTDVSETIVSDCKIRKKPKVDVKNISVQEPVHKIDCTNLTKQISINDENNFKNETSNNNYQFKTQQLAPVEHNVEGDLELSDEASDITDELQITCKEGDGVTNVLHKGKSVGDDENCKEKSKKICKVQKKDITVLEENNDKHKNITKEEHCKDKEENLQINVDGEKVSEEIFFNKNETCKKKTSKKKGDEKSDKDTQIIEKTNESSSKQVKELKKGEKRKRLSSKDTEKENKESKVSHINTGENEIENKPKDLKPCSKFTELFGESSSLITPEDLNIPSKFEVSIERNDNYGSLFENTQDAIDLNVRDIKVSQTDNSNLKVLENVNAFSMKEDSLSTINEKLFEIKGDQANDNVFKNLKPAIIDDESNIVKTVVISSGIQPCIEDQTSKKIQTEIGSTEAKETERVVKHQPLELLRAIATSTPNKMQHEDFPGTATEVTPDGENVNLSYSASLTTATNVEVNSDAPDVRIFIKRRRKIKKI